MSKMLSTNVQDNEILKAIDVNNGFDAQITNITKALQSIMDNDKDFVIGKDDLISYNSTQEADWTLKLAPIYGTCHSTGLCFMETEQAVIAVNQPVNNQARRDVIEVCGVFETINPQKRSFIDFDTKATSVSSVDTQKTLALRCRCLSTETPGSIEPPTHSEGWVKIGELYIPGDATKISDCTIYNITSDIKGGENTYWEAEKTATYNVGYYSSIKNLLRTSHNKDGSLKNNIVKKDNLSVGTDSDDVNGNVIYTGSNITVAEDSHVATETITQLLIACAAKITDLYNNYLKLGAFKFNGGLEISSKLDGSVLQNSIRIGADGEGNAWIRLDNIGVFTFVLSGSDVTVVKGKYPSNKNLNNYHEVIGDGTSDTDRSNVYAVDKNGNIKTRGNVYVEADTNSENGKILPKCIEMTKAEYDALVDKDPDTFYCITDINNDPIVIDESLDESSVNPVQNKVIAAKINTITTNLDKKQETLESGVNIKTINSNSILGSGDIVIESSKGTEITESDYEALPEEEKKDGTVYYITDKDYPDLKAIDDNVTTDSTTWSSEKINSTFGEYTKDVDTLSSVDTSSNKPVNSSAISGALANQLGTYKIGTCERSDYFSLTTEVGLMDYNAHTFRLFITDLSTGNCVTINGTFKRNTYLKYSASSGGMGVTSSNQYGTLVISGLSTTVSNNQYQIFYK